MSYMAEPERVFRNYLEASGHECDQTSFLYGKTCASLQVISLIKDLETIPVLNDLPKEATITALLTLLEALGAPDQAWELYEHLALWRRPKFVADRVPSRPTNGGADVIELSRRRGTESSSHDDPPLG